MESLHGGGFHARVIRRIPATLLALLAAGASLAQIGPSTPRARGQRTPRSGEGFRADLFGSPIEIAARDRRTVLAWEGGADLSPDADDYETVPFGSLYLWHHPDDRRLLRASLAGVGNELFFASTGPDGSEWLASFESFTLPWATGELLDGDVLEPAKRKWGYVRPGLGIGYRTRMPPFEQDNLFASDILVEPGLLWFGRGDETARSYVLPDSTFELRVRWQTRYDALVRNLLELPHEGFAMGLDAVAGRRLDASAYALPSGGLESGHRRYVQATAYAFLIGPVPWVDSDRHRILGSVHVGAGRGLDAFSAVRVGGGPDLRGEEFATTSRPWLPGSAWGEFFPDHYAMFSAGYRAELTFFAFLDAGATLAFLDRDRAVAGGFERRDGWLSALSVRLSSGFLWSTRIQIGYAHGFDAIRNGRRGADEVVFAVTGRF
ncbi:MAG: hypothetical protein Fur0037_21660 [Planctomycetota bacterium]